MCSITREKINIAVWAKSDYSPNATSSTPLTSTLQGGRILIDNMDSRTSETVYRIFRVLMVQSVLPSILNDKCRGVRGWSKHIARG